MISKIDIENFKCFSKRVRLSIAVPDGNTNGSGLTIFVGDNNSGKTAALQAIAKLKPNGFIDDDEKSNGQDVEILIEDENGGTRSIKNIPGDSIIANDTRPNNLNFQFADIYYVKDNKIWSADFNRGRTVFGNYRENIDVERSSPDSQFAQVLSQLKREHPDLCEEFNKTLKKVITGFVGWNISSNRRGQLIRYELSHNRSLDINYSLGSGNLNIFKMVFGLVDPESKTVIIDEPEAFLHPIAQIKLAQVINQKSKHKQVILTTHSPYLIKGLLSQNCHILIFKKRGAKFTVQNTKNKNFGLFGISPTLGEISYSAYELATVEFHNELYGFVQSKYKLSTIKSFDDFLVDKHSEARKKWMFGSRAYRGLSTYIRNYVHHPEDRGNNTAYTDAELKKSIRFLVKMVKKK